MYEMYKHDADFHGQWTFLSAAQWLHSFFP